MEPHIETVSLSTKRPFSWRALVILGALQFIGNLAALPLLRQTNAPVEPVSAWILWTAVSLPIIAIGLYLGGRVGLGAPLVEGLLGGSVREWSRRVACLGLLVAVAGSLPFLLVNLDVQPESYPPFWQLVLASVDAGVQEEIFSRLFVMTLLVWLGGVIWRDDAGRPTRGVLWTAIVLAGLVFGWGHIDDQLSVPGIRGALAGVMLLNTAYGIAFGWLYWKQGLESAILAHFLVDAIGSAVVMPAYLADNLWLGLLVLGGLILAGVVSVWLVVHDRSGTERPAT